jgi:hypothetical protein
MNGSDVLAAADTVRALLAPELARDWTARVPDLDFTVASALAHAGDCALWYALDVWGGAADDAAFEVRVRPDAGNSRILTSVSSAAHVCAASVDAAPADLLGFHPFGAADGTGFAAMACDELLVHGDDAARGLALRLLPPADLALRVLARLFPWHEPGDDPWRTLLWANGRVDLPGRESQRRWRWHTAPLDQWDGQPPAQAQ